MEPQPENPPNLEQAIRRLAAEVMRGSRLSREQIAAQMSTLLGLRISVHMLNDYTAASHRGARFPAAWVPVFCQVTGDHRLPRLLLGASDRQRLELAESELRAAREERERNALREKLLAESSTPGPGAC
jgi:hypothetical protein